jgi:hypothetical protein
MRGLQAGQAQDSSRASDDPYGTRGGDMPFVRAVCAMKLVLYTGGACECLLRTTLFPADREWCVCARVCVCVCGFVLEQVVMV